MKRYLLSGTGLVILAVLFLAFNVVDNTLLAGHRLDLTQHKLYTLSHGTLDIIRHIDEPINLYFFYSRSAGDQLPRLGNYARRVRNLLKEYALRSNGKLKLHVINPAPFSNAEDRAGALGLQAVPVGNDGTQLYFGLAATSPIGTHDAIPFFHPKQQALLEYDISKLIYSVEHPKKPTIGVISDLPLAGSYNPRAGGASPPWEVYREAKSLFKMKILPHTIEKVGKDIDALWVVDPEHLDAKTRYAIDQFILGGGKAMIFVDPLAESVPPAPGQNPYVAAMTRHSSDLPALFGSWGLSLRKGDVVLDPKYALAIRTGRGGGTTEHPALLGLTGHAFNRKDVVTNQLQQVDLGFAGALSWKKLPKGLSITPLLQSASDARLVPAATAAASHDPSTLMESAQGKAQRYTLAVRISGHAKTAFPEGPPKGDKNAGHLTASKGSINAIVVADTDMLADNYWVEKGQFFQRQLIQPFADNGNFVINGLDNLTGGKDLISIRGRAVYSRPFVRVQALRREANAQFQSKEQELEHELTATKQKLARLKTTDNGKEIILSKSQRNALRKFRHEELSIREQLRHVRHQLDKDIQRLGMWLKIINIGFVPLLVALFGIGLAIFRHHRRKQAQEWVHE